MKPIFIEQFLPEQILNLLHSYCVIKFSNKTTFSPEIKTTKSLINDYSDYLMETILDMSTPVVEQNVGKKLFPTYSYLRVYDKLSSLPVHNDRPSCEFTVALCLGADPMDVPYNIYIGSEDNNSDYKFMMNDNESMNLNIEYKFPMLPNNALIFSGRGPNELHWREECKHDYFITVFLHYVDQEGELKDHRFDGRSQLGAPKA